MVFRLKTSKRTEEIFKELESRAFLKPYTLVKHAIVWSLRERTSVRDYRSDVNGLDLNRQTITGDYESIFKVLIEEVEGRKLDEEEFFPTYLKSHIDRGALILIDKYNHAKTLDAYVEHTLGKGDTV